MKFARSDSHCIARHFVLLAAAPLVFAGAAPNAFAQSQTGFTYNGMAYTSYSATEYLETPQGPNGVAAMAATGVNYATVLVTQYVSGPTSNTIAANGSTPTDAAVVAAITNLQQQGIRVALKPQVDSLDAAHTWRGEFEPTNVADWFASYQTFIVHYATIAQAQGADVFVIGCEFATLSGSAYESNWDTVIAAVRAVYTGPITYAANATSAGDEFTKVSFWGRLDMIGVDGYFPLTNHADPTVAQLVSAWTTAAGNVNGFAPETALKNLQASYPNLPLIFTEIGYPSAVGSNEAPYNYSPTGSYDPTEQEDCYEAYFEVFSKDTSWMKGVFWWAWSVSPPGANDTGYSPRNKPAGDVTLPLWYGASAPNFRITPVSSALTLSQGLSTSDTVVVTEFGGMTGGVALSASGLPDGVTASFGTNPTTGASVMTLTAATTAAAGTATVAIKGVSGSLTGSATIALTVNPAPGFALNIPLPPAVTAIPGAGNAAAYITINDLNGFTGAVSLAATGLPSGVTAAWTTNPATTNSTLLLTASSTTPLGGPFTVTITGTAPQCQAVICPLISSSTTVNVTVDVSQGFTLSASPASLTVVQGGSGSSTIAATLAGGLVGPVTLTASGLPTGVTANSCTTEPGGPVLPGFDQVVGCQLTFTASSTATVGGPVTVTINGIAPPGGPITCGIPCELTASTTIALTVAVPPSFTLSASPASLTLVQGSSGSSTITATLEGGLTGPLTLAASALPTGVTATWGVSNNYSIVVTLTASDTATLGGPVTYTINGIVGTVTASTTIALTVTAAPVPALALSASPSSLTATAGSGGSSTITVTPSGGFTGSVTLTAAITATPANAENPPTSSFGSTSPVTIPSASQTATLTLSTTAASGGCTASNPMQREVPWSVGGGTALACILLFGIPARRRRWRKMIGLLALLVALAGGVTACGGSGSKVCGTAFRPATTSGAYTITVTADSGAITPATTAITLNVQ